MHTVKNYHDYAPDVQALFQASISVREKAYAPYSKFKVGAALLTCTGDVYTGCNVENASFPLTTCAERSAIVKAISEGQRQFVSIAVCGAFEGKEQFVTPCGGCRQNIFEFSAADNDIAVYLVKPSQDEVLETTITSLLPLSFKF